MPKCETISSACPLRETRTSHSLFRRFFVALCLALCVLAGGVVSTPFHFSSPFEHLLLRRDDALVQTDISRPLGTITYDMLVLALQEEGEWLKVKHRTLLAQAPNRRRRRLCFISNYPA